MAEEQAIHECCCARSLAGDDAAQRNHRQLRRLLSRLDEQQRRWVASREAIRLGHGGNDDLRDWPTDHVRLPGGGRPRVKKLDFDHRLAAVR